MLGRGLLGARRRYALRRHRARRERAPLVREAVRASGGSLEFASPGFGATRLWASGGRAEDGAVVVALTTVTVAVVGEVGDVDLR